MKLIFKIFISFCLIGNSFANTPNPADLKSYYCIAYLNDGINLMNKATEFLKSNGTNEMKKDLEKNMGVRNFTHARNRILRYIEPRLKNLDVEPLILAFSQFEDDRKFLSNYFATQCNASEPTICGERFKKDYPEIIKKQQSCQSLEWLPF